ncbi:hypothetical protein Tco_0390444 [Tanacetum coccineum]
MVSTTKCQELLHMDLFGPSAVQSYGENCWDLKKTSGILRVTTAQSGQFRNQDNTRKQGNNEDTSSKAMLAIDGVGFDWSDMTEEQVQTNIALMAFSDSEVYTDKTCSKTCLKNYETLKKQCDDLIVKLNQTEFIAATYKRGLATVEEQLITYRKNKVLFSEKVAVLKREVACKDYEINVLKSEFEKVKKEKEGIEFKIEKFDKASKDLDQLLGNLKSLICLIPGLDEFKEPEFKGYGPENSKQESNVVCDKKSDNSKENSDESLVLGDYSKPSHEGYRNTIELPDPNQHFKDFLKLVDSLDLDDVPSTSDRCPIELENQVQRLMEAHLAPMQPTQVNKITSSCEICSGPHDTQNCMENPE